LLTESLVMALVGGALGLLVAEWCVTALLALAPKDIPRLAEVRVDWGVIAFTTTVCLATGLLFGLAPALQTMSVAPQDVLRDAGARTAGTSGAHVTRAALVIAQVAMALMLVSAAALMVTSFNRLQAVDPGFRTDQVLSVGLSLPPARYPAPARQHQFYQQVLERLQATPIASSSALVFPMPLRASSAQAIFDIDGRKTAPGQPKPTAAIASIAPGYFRTLSVPILQGRDITAQDTDTAPPVAIVSTTFAAKYWPNENPLGKRLQFDDEGGEAVTVVGLVGDIRGYGLDREAPPTLYFPYQQFTVPYSSLVLRSSARPGDVATALRDIVHRIDPELPIDDVKPLDASIGEAIAQPRFQTMLLMVFAGAALVLALVGVYGVISYAVSQRRLELGVRAALGATPIDLLTLVMRQGLTLAAIGVLAGLVGTFALSGLLKGLLYGVGATDPPHARRRHPRAAASRRHRLRRSRAARHAPGPAHRPARPVAGPRQRRGGRTSVAPSPPVPAR
jgi:predicted permease